MTTNPDTQLKPEDLPPTCELVCEVLAARYRLGENVWTISRNRTTTRALDQLADLGWVGYKPGWVENTWLAWLTEIGRERCMSRDYTSPVMRDAEKWRWHHDHERMPVL